MLREERFLKITDYLKKVRTAKFSEIAQYLGVSEATARKDIAFLDSKGAVRLTRGGAVWNQDDITKQVSKVRNIINREEKRQLVRSLGSFVMDGQAVALNGGTTTVEAARFLAHNYRRLTVLTNNLTALSL